MGSFHSADAITGRSFTNNEPVIALVLRPVVQEHEEHAEMAIAPTLYPQDRFEPQSFIIHGHADADLRFIPNNDQPSVNMLLGTFNKDSWDQFAIDALNRDNNGQGVIVPAPALGKNKKNHPEFLGLFLIAQSTYASIMRIFNALTSENDIQICMAILRDANIRCKDGYNDEYEFAKILYGYPKIIYELLDGTKLRVPDLFNVIPETNKPNDISYASMYGFNHVGIKMTDILLDDAEDQIYRKIQALSNFSNLMIAMSYLGIQIIPSSNKGASANNGLTALFLSNLLVNEMKRIKNDEKFSIEFLEEPHSAISKIEKNIRSSLQQIKDYQEGFYK